MAHAHHHHHHEHHAAVSRKLTIATIANVIIVVAELVVGFGVGSLALIGDALHNLTDAAALVLALIAVRLERRPATTAKTYGYQRAGILAAFVNSGLLLVLTGIVVKEAIERLRAPQAVGTGAMLITATLALIVNAATAISLRSEGRHDVNIRSAVIHMIGDAVSSAGIIAGAILIRMTGAMEWDAIVSLFIGVLILWSSWGVLKESVNLLLEGTPSGIDAEEVSRTIGAIDGVLGVHHLHIWAIGAANASLSCHLMVGDVPVRSTGKLLDDVNAMLARDYGIAHTTIQFEFANCAEDDPFCVPYTVR